MATTRRSPNVLLDGMVVRKVSQPSAALRVSRDHESISATYVSLTKGQRTVLRGNARSYRPETTDEAADREGVDLPESEPDEDTARAARALHAVEPIDEGDPASDVADCCATLKDAVAEIANGTCSPQQAAEIVRAAAELNWAVMMNGGRGLP